MRKEYHLLSHTPAVLLPALLLGGGTLLFPLKCAMVLKACAGRTGRVACVGCPAESQGMGVISNEGEFSAEIKRLLIKQHRGSQGTVLMLAQSSAEMKPYQQVLRAAGSEGSVSASNLSLWDLLSFSAFNLFFWCLLLSFSAFDLLLWYLLSRLTLQPNYCVWGGLSHILTSFVDFRIDTSVKSP